MSDWQDFIKLYATPELQRPYLVAGWSGMGAVALLAVNFLRQELGATLLGEVDPCAFFSPSQVRIADRLLQTPEFPENRFYFWQQVGAAHDLLFFVGTEQPSQGYQMALLILDLAEHFGVERIYTAAAFPTLIHHRQDAGVWGTATHADLLAEVEAYGVRIMDKGTIGGLNGLLLAAGKERELEGLCLLGEIPVYATQTINPKASSVVLTVLTQMLGIEINLTKLALWADDLTPQMDRLYKLLPAHAKEAIEGAEAAEASPPPPALAAGEEFVADEAFFDEIERFLQQHWQAKDDEDEDEDNSPP
jgi:proteasome assembly chaperone (PAC2) family protein